MNAAKLEVFKSLESDWNTWNVMSDSLQSWVCNVQDYKVLPSFALC